MNLRRQYLLLLGDVRGSTSNRPAERRALFAKLDGLIAALTEELGDELLLGLTRSYGDEVAGLFQGWGRVYEVIRRLRDGLDPMGSMRFVVARGRIGVSSDDITQVGGAVFKTASGMMERVKKERRFCRWALGQRQLDLALDPLVEMSNTLIESMTPYQRQVYEMLRAGEAQVSIARKLGKHQQSVSEAARRGRAEVVIEAEDAIRELLASGA